MIWERFCGLAEAWGGDIDRWPEQERAGARQFAETPEGRAVIRRARDLDRLLAFAPSPHPDRAAIASFAVIQRIAAQNDRRSWTFQPVLAWNRLVLAGSLACSFAIGASLALAVPYGRPPPQQALLGMILDNATLPMLR
ncbi:MAG TPA: hypothetical protein VIY51_02735 [Xanthobacteraceae bacterium]